MNAAAAAAVVLDRDGRPTLDYRGKPELILPGLKEWGRSIGVAFAMAASTAKKINDHITGKSTYTSPAPLYLALTTVAVLASDTSASITEANYTGYARLQIPAADWNAATGTTSATSTTANQKLFAACTAGTSTVIGWALTPISTTGGAGDVTEYGTCTSTVISTTATPATVNAGSLSIGLS